MILRLWRMENSTDSSWRASVEIQSGQRFGFSSLEQLFVFLIDFTENSCEIKNLAQRKGEFKKVSL